MSQENVELARHYFEAYNDKGQKGTQHLRHPDIEMFDPPNFPDADRYVGEAAVAKLVEDYLEIGWDGQFWDAEYLDAGEEVVVIWQARIRAAHGGGVPFEGTFAHVLLFEDGKVRCIRQYLSRGEALEAAGQRE
jgi:ketosteroid isomerase-like protein